MFDVLILENNRGVIIECDYPNKISEVKVKMKYKKFQFLNYLKNKRYSDFLQKYTI